MIRPERAALPEQNASSDEDLVRLAAQGSLEAFGALYERYLPRVYNWVRCVVPEQDVEDVTQETFIALMKSLRTFRGGSQFGTWLHTLARRRIADYYRSRNPADAPAGADLSEVDDHAVAGASRFAHNPTEDDTLMLRLAIAHLPERYKDIVRLRFAEGLQFNEIAQISGLSLEATKSLFRRAIAALRSHMGENDA